MIKTLPKVFFFFYFHQLMLKKKQQQTIHSVQLLSQVNTANQLVPKMTAT